jgi:hypothetical protein
MQRPTPNPPHGLPPQVVVCEHSSTGLAGLHESVDALALCVVGLMSSTAGSQTIDGTGAEHGFAVSDGDTVRFGRQAVRLFGIDAPEKGQACDAGRWFPGPLATKALVDFIGGRSVGCRQVDYDGKNNRPVALCFAGDDDLQAVEVALTRISTEPCFGDSPRVLELVHDGCRHDPILRKGD